MVKRPLKVLDKTFTPLHPGIRALNDPPSGYRDKARFPWRGLLRFRRLWGEFKANLSHDLRVKLLQGCDDLLGVIAMVEQNRNFRDVNGLRPKVV